jgi:glycosyltransferase involved in cell wall biosynthesis
MFLRDAVMGGKMASPLVSIVICAYQNWPDLEMTIESALQQSYQPIEVIVVDNSSTDPTPREVPEKFGGRVRYICQPNKQCAGACNTGFDLARGEFIQFVDGDDVLAPNKIAKQMEFFQANPELDIVYGDVRRFQTLPEAANWVDEPAQPEPDMLGRLVLSNGGPCGLDNVGMLVRRRAIERVGHWDESLYVEDFDYWLRAAYAGCRFGYCPGSPMGFARQHPGQKSRNATVMSRGYDAVLQKALGYVTREPYRSVIATGIADRKYQAAVARAGMTRREAWTLLGLARSLSPGTVSAPAYAFGWAIVALPGASALVRIRWLRYVRRAMAWLLGYHSSK